MLNTVSLQSILQMAVIHPLSQEDSSAARKEYGINTVFSWSGVG